MIELHLVLEGPSEEAFVKNVLGPHLVSFGVSAIPMIVRTSRERDGRKHRGGGNSEKWFKDIQLLLRDRRPVIRVTTIFDLYGLPRGFPGLKDFAATADTHVRCDQLEAAMAAAVDDKRFIPYLQRHEFEALVLAGLPTLEGLLDQPVDKKGLVKLRANIGAIQPEDVNDNVNTAPSKRLARFIPSYSKGKSKPYFAEQVTVRTGLAALRAKCPRFSAWVSQLETLRETAARPAS